MSVSANEGPGRAAAWALSLLLVAGAWTLPSMARAAHPKDQGAAAPCDAWRLLLRDGAGQGPDELRFRLEYREAPPPGRRWRFYGLALTREDPERPSLGQLTADDLAPLTWLGEARRGEPLYALADWYLRSAPRTLYLIRLGDPHPRLAALGLEVRPETLPAGFRPKFHGPERPPLLPLEPARIRGLPADALVCRARRP